MENTWKKYKANSKTKHQREFHPFSRPQSNIFKISQQIKNQTARIKTLKSNRIYKDWGKAMGAPENLSSMSNSDRSQKISSKAKQVKHKSCIKLIKNEQKSIK